MEDEESDALFMQRAFTSAGLESVLRIVGDGRTAIAYLSGSGVYGDRDSYPVPAVVLLDLNLPGVHGFQVLKWIRSHPDYTGIPVLIFSGTTHASDKAKALELGANEFVQKPTSGMKFPELVRSLKEKWL